MRRLLPLLALAVLVAGCAAVYHVPALRELLFPRESQGEPAGPGSQEPDAPPETPDQPPEEPAEPEAPSWEAEARALLADMTVEEKVGQLFFVRCPEEAGAEKAAQYHLGGYILFGRDFRDSAGSWLTEDQVTATIAGYQAAARADTGIPLLIGVDEEGGTVVRASANPNLFPHRCLSPQDLYAQGGMEAVLSDAAAKNATLLQLGINVNFAPVADVSTDPGDFIYDRAFGQDAQATADYVAAVVESMGETGIGTVLKHFPGYGNNVDTHTGIAVDQRPYETFLDADFLPFSAGIAAGADSVLVSHNIVTAMDGALPASLSPEVHRIAREELGFAGVLLTDDLAMDAVRSYAEDGSVAVLAVLAGNDMIVTTDFEEQIPLVIQAVEDGTIPESQIDQSVLRVLTWKHRLGLI